MIKKQIKRTNSIFVLSATLALPILTATAEQDVASTAGSAVGVNTGD